MNVTDAERKCAKEKCRKEYWNFVGKIEIIFRQINKIKNLMKSKQISTDKGNSIIQQLTMKVVALNKKNNYIKCAEKLCRKIKGLSANNTHDLLKKCTIKHCKKQRESYMKRVVSFTKVMTDLFHKKMNLVQIRERIQKESMKVFKSAERLQLTNCQLKHCHQEKYNHIIKSLQDILDSFKNDKSNPKYKYAEQYMQLFTKNKFTPTNINKYYIDKIKLNLFQAD
jgi:hypothetical protein